MTRPRIDVAVVLVDVTRELNTDNAPAFVDMLMPADPADIYFSAAAVITILADRLATESGTSVGDILEALRWNLAALSDDPTGFF